MIESPVVADELVRCGRRGQCSRLAMALEVGFARKDAEWQLADTSSYKSRLLRTDQSQGDVGFPAGKIDNRRLRSKFDGHVRISAEQLVQSRNYDVVDQSVTARHAQRARQSLRTAETRTLRGSNFRLDPLGMAAENQASRSRVDALARADEQFRARSAFERSNAPAHCRRGNAQ
jgi:hypothetical protein